MSYLVAQQTTATAIDEDLTELIAWVNVENYSAFRVITENTGGGSADVITDVQVDTSTDGGTTIVADAVDVTPAADIASGTSDHVAFVSTGKYIRVRAKCGAGLDTTSKCFLMADTVTGRLCLLQDVRDRIGKSDGDTVDDAAINDIIRGMSSTFDQFCNRTILLNSAAATEYYDGGYDCIMLPRFPLATVTSITESAEGTYDWDNETALTNNEDYRVINSTGWIKRLHGNEFMEGIETVRIVYTGGYVAPGITVGTGETALPDSIREAAIEQSQFIFKRRDDIGLTSVSTQGMSVTKFSAIDLLPMVKKILNKYKNENYL